VRVHLEGRSLLLSGRVGSVAVDLGHMDPTGLLGLQLWQRPAAGGAVPAGAPPAAAGAPPAAAGGETLLLAVSPSRRYFKGIASHVNNCVTGVTQGHLVGLTVNGVGFRLEPVEAPPARRGAHFERGAYEKATATYPYTKLCAAVRLKVGYTRTAIFPLPEGVKAFFVKPTLMYLYGALRRCCCMCTVQCLLKA